MTRLHIDAWRRVAPRGMAFAALVLVLLSAGCGSSSSAGGGAPANPAWVVIDSPVPDADGYCRTDCASAYLSGTASISDSWYHCCGGTAEEMTGVTVTWVNSANGQSGKAAQSARICYFFGTPWICEHDWSADVSLVVGVNHVTVTASDLAGYSNTTSVDIILPAEPHTVSGSVQTQTGAPFVTASNVGAWLSLDDGLGHVRTGTSGTDGLFALGCVQPGTYTLTPYVPNFTYPFTPVNRLVVMGAADIVGQDFVTTVRRVSGHVDGPAGAYTDGFITLTGAAGTISAVSANAGDYALLVPDGTYRLTVSCGGMPCLSVSPSAIDVTVAGADVPNQDFSVLP